MSSFSYSIQTAFLLFPFVALFFTLPYMLFQYHKYGSINSYRTILIYSFLLYLMCAYFLVILPLPSMESVRKMTTPNYNLEPFHFIKEILNKTSFHVSDFRTYFPTMKNPAFYEAFFNMLLTVPFGVYLHYYFKCDFKKTACYSFCLSLFFELTQITGLYFIYPRSYRVFDVDDLIINTLGGCVGYVIAFLLLKFLPTREEIDEKSIQKGSNVSILRRSLSLLLDMTLFFLTLFCFCYLLRNVTALKIVFLSGSIIFFLLYFGIIPIILKGSTMGMKFLKLKFKEQEKTNKLQYFNYYFFLFLEFMGLPFLFLFLSFFLLKQQIIAKDIYEYFLIGILGTTLMIYTISFLKRIFKMQLLYEKITKLSIVSTIKS